MDLSEERVRVVKSAAVSVLNRKRRNLRVEATTDLREAVEGADLVIYTIRVGGLEALGVCGGSYVNVKCGQCERLKVSGVYFYCEPDDSCSCSREGCDSGWRCKGGICQQGDVTKQCRALIGGNCNDYYDILGVCQMSEPEAKWTAQVDFLCSESLRKGWCYNRPECNDVCGNDEGMPCGAYGKKAYRGQRCTFNPRTLRCEVVNDKTCDHPPVNFEWRNVGESSAEIYIEVTADKDYAGSIKFAIRKNVFGRDPYCDLEGECSWQSKYFTAFSKVSKGKHTFTTTFTARESGKYHFDVYYESYHYGRTEDVHLKGIPSTECGGSCGEINCGECEVCISGECVPNDQCSCSSCQGGSCVCRDGKCVKSCSAECRDAGYLYVGCKCRPREKGSVYLELDPQPCMQDCPLFRNPRECACRVDERCGAVCGSDENGLKYCKPDERCTFVQTGSSGSDYSGYGKCEYDPSCDKCTGPQDCGSVATNDAGTKFYCVYQNGDWVWAEQKPDKFCCDDKDCSVYGEDWYCDKTVYRCKPPTRGREEHEECPDKCFDDMDNDGDGYADYCDSDCVGCFECPEYYYGVYDDASWCDDKCRDLGFTRGEVKSCGTYEEACVCYTECCTSGSIEECGYETCEAKGYPNRYKECEEVIKTPKYTIYECWCGPCRRNEDCTPGTCCTREGPATTGNPGPGKPRDEAQCKKLENPWLCDPPSKNFLNLLNLQPSLIYR